MYYVRSGNTKHWFSVEKCWGKRKDASAFRYLDNAKAVAEKWPLANAYVVEVSFAIKDEGAGLYYPDAAPGEMWFDWTPSRARARRFAEAGEARKEVDCESKVVRLVKQVRT